MSETHIPVLRNEVINFLKPKPNGVYLDATIGLGGHSQHILQQSHPTGRVFGIDLDVNALAFTEKRLHDYKDRLTLIHGNYAQLSELLENYGLKEVDGVLLDLGVSSLQLDTPNRGFSFQRMGPLDMRMDKGMSISAAHIINNYTSDKLIRIFKEYGEEQFANRIVRNIINKRLEKPITTTLQLAEIVEKVYPKKLKPPYHNKKTSNIHPATKVFQALRIEVNAELDNLTLGLEAALLKLKPGGCLCVISFQSLEDRIVKRFFQQGAKHCICPPKTPICICEHEQVLHIITKKPILPSDKETETNPRSRSAKLRVATKIS